MGHLHRVMEMLMLSLMLSLGFRPVSSLLLKAPLRRPFAVLSSGSDVPQPMANIYLEWSLEDDQLLFENRREPLPELASLLGRGLKGVESRLAKLNDVESPAYARLFAGRGTVGGDHDKKADKLVPAKEVLRRVVWDYNLREEDFSVLYYDRVDDKILMASMKDLNTSVQGQEETFVFAIPEHRIEGIKFRERMVWDKQQRIDRVFGSMRGEGETIDQVVAGYDEWKRRKDAAEEWNRQRQKEVSGRIQSMLGLANFGVLKELSVTFQSNCKDSGVSVKQEAERYVVAALKVFQKAREDAGMNPDPLSVPQNDYDSLDVFSELVALLPDSTLRPAILSEISISMTRLDGHKAPSQGLVEVVELNEDDLTETFVRGSGSGGQKINKTSNKVVLVHEPTQLRVECQDTRSLQQNRKIARKRMRLKLDEFLNGNESKMSVKAKTASIKKAKAKARNKARQKKKKEAASPEET